MGSIDLRPSRVESRRPIQVEFIDRGEGNWRRIDRQPRLDRLRGLLLYRLALSLFVVRITVYVLKAHGVLTVNVWFTFLLHSRSNVSYINAFLM